MAKKHQLRQLRTNTVINGISIKQEKDIAKAIANATHRVRVKRRVTTAHSAMWNLADIVDQLRREYPAVDFFHHFDNTSLRPDGGITYLLDRNEVPRPILIAEVKNQGTNDLRLAEGKAKQAKGNAIERLGKNVIGFRSAMLTESIFPFVCFGYGCDFEETSSILDRVVTIAMFGKLNQIHLHNQGPNGEFDRGSFYFRSEKWTLAEMEEILFEVADRSVLYYFSKYGESNFIRSEK